MPPRSPVFSPGFMGLVMSGVLSACLRLERQLRCDEFVMLSAEKMARRGHDESVNGHYTLSSCPGQPLRRPPLSFLNVYAQPGSTAASTRVSLRHVLACSHPPYRT